MGTACQIGTSANGVSFDSCANDLYCRNLFYCANHAAQTLGGARCAVPEPEGALCDSEFPGYNGGYPDYHCKPCAPGLSCKRAGLNDSNRCVRSCTSDSDCPCPSGGAGTCATLPDGSKACTACSSLGQACDSYRTCCASGDQCGTTNNGSPDVCCRSTGSSCTTQAECCGASSGNPIVCATTGSGKSCQACKKGGVACTNTDQCCNGGTCTGGLCRMPCTAGGNCNTSLKGACKAGHYECDAVGNQTCVSNTSPAANDATCDGKDNDCDGKVDEDVPNPISDCTVTKTAAECGYPTDFQAKGQLVCKNGATVCETKPNVSYCTSASGGPCGQAYQQPCNEQNKCGIGLVCSESLGYCVHYNPQCLVPALGCYPLNSPYLGACLP